MSNIIFVSSEGSILHKKKKNRNIFFLKKDIFNSSLWNLFLKDTNVKNKKLEILKNRILK